MQKLSKKQEKDTMKLIEGVLSNNKKIAIDGLKNLVKDRIASQIKKVSETEDLI